MLVHCKVKPELLDALRDGELRGLRASLLRAHVRLCSRCQQYLAEADEVSALLEELPELEPSPALGERVRASVELTDEPVLDGLATDLQAPPHLGGADFTRSVLWRVADLEQRRKARRLTLLAVAAAVALMVFSASLYVCASRSQNIAGLGPLRPIVLHVMHLRSVVQSLDPAQWLRKRTQMPSSGIWRRKAEQAGLKLEDLVGAPTSPPPDGSAPADRETASDGASTSPAHARRAGAR